MEIKILTAIVGHERKHPAHNRFEYRVFYLDIPISQKLGTLPALFSFERFNIFSIYGKDHGVRDAASFFPWFKERCAEKGISVGPEDTVRLIAHPRLFGYAFNPISFWVLQDAARNVRAVLCEVHNTFGDDHNYLLSHTDGRPMLSSDVFRAEKKLYVSPFNTMQGYYLFSFSVHDERFETHIKYFVADELTIDAYMGGSTRPLTTGAIVLSVFRYPFMTLMVVYRIHFQAVRLRLKRVRSTLDQRPAHTSGKTSYETE
jgi:DUF1365 family protein